MVMISTLVATFFFLEAATQGRCYRLHMLCSLLNEHIFCYTVAMSFPDECSVAVHMIVGFSNECSVAVHMIVGFPNECSVAIHLVVG